MLKLLAATLSGCFLLCSQAVSRSNETDFLNMSLEELLEVRVHVPAAITKLGPLQTPASITNIDQELIRMTPARNLYDLIESYVPGAFWMNHEKGPRLAVRGIITNRNSKFLLLVNGRNMNHKSTYGAKSELEMWDLSDIESIDVVRGPGSVTYGPGAIAGVINITTKSSAAGTGVSVAIGILTSPKVLPLAMALNRKTTNSTCMLVSTVLMAMPPNNF